MEKTIRVLMITSEYPEVNHPDRVPFITRQVRFLREAGVDVDVFPFSGNKKLINYIREWRRLGRYTAGESYDLVHAQWGQSALLALPKRLPWVITFRGNDLEGIVGENNRYTFRGRVQQIISKLMGRLADEVIVVSESLSRHLTRTDYHVIPSGLDFEHFRPLPQNEARAMLHLPPDKRLILLAGRRNPRKRFELAEAAVELISERCNAELVIASEVPHREIPIYMNACDALILTSMHEGSPNVVKEALACDLPVVSTAVGDVPQRIGNLEGCAVVDEASPEALAAALEKVLSNPRRIKGREVVRHLDENLIARRVIEVYQKALQAGEAKEGVLQITSKQSEF